MNPATILKLVLLLGVVLLVVAIGIRARLEEPLLLLRRPALALRTMVSMYVALPAFVLVLTQETISAAYGLHMGLGWRRRARRAPPRAGCHRT